MGLKETAVIASTIALEQVLKQPNTRNTSSSLLTRESLWQTILRVKA